MDSLLQAGRIPGFRLLSRRRLAPAQPRERHYPGDLGSREQRDERAGEGANRADNVDAIIALCMALERADHMMPAVELLGWL
jgi:hypothetical protein